MPSTLVPMVTELGPLPSRAEDSAEEMPVCPSQSLDQSPFFLFQSYVSHTIPVDRPPCVLLLLFVFQFLVIARCL